MKNIKQLLEWFKFQYNTIWNICHWLRMKQKARFKKWASRNPYDIFFVIPFTKTSLGVISQSQRQDYNKACMRQGLKTMTHNQLVKSAYYCTGKIIKLK